MKVTVLVLGKNDGRPLRLILPLFFIFLGVAVGKIAFILSFVEPKTILDSNSTNSNFKCHNIFGHGQLNLDWWWSARVKTNVLEN